MGTWNGCGEQPVSFLFPMRLNLGALSGAQLLTRRVVGGILDWCGGAAREFPLFSHVRLYSGNAQRRGAKVLTRCLAVGISDGCVGAGSECPFPDAVEFRRAQRGQSANAAVRLCVGISDGCVGTVGEFPFPCACFERAQRSQKC